MDKASLTADERMALRMWFRQALGELEKKELRERLLSVDAEEVSHGHRVTPVRKRPSRVSNGQVKETVP
jgi:hypothetical protein